MGGLSKYWGGGFFPFDLLDLNEDIKKFILNKFKFSNPNKFNYFGIKNINKEFVKSLEVKVLTSPENQDELLSPGIEMEKLCQIYNIRLIRNAIVDKLTFSKKVCVNFCFDDYKIKSEYLLLGAGAIGSPKILYNSEFY